MQTENFKEIDNRFVMALSYYSILQYVYLSNKKPIRYFANQKKGAYSSIGLQGLIWI